MSYIPNRSILNLELRPTPKNSPVTTPRFNLAFWSWFWMFSIYLNTSVSQNSMVKKKTNLPTISLSTHLKIRSFSLMFPSFSFFFHIFPMNMPCSSAELQGSPTPPAAVDLPPSTATAQFVVACAAAPHGEDRGRRWHPEEPGAGSFPGTNSHRIHVCYIW